VALLENRAGTANSALEDAARFRIGEDAPATTVGDEATGWSNDRAADEGVTSLELTFDKTTLASKVGYRGDAGSDAGVSTRSSCRGDCFGDDTGEMRTHPEDDSEEPEEKDRTFKSARAPSRSDSS